MSAVAAATGDAPVIRLKIVSIGDANVGKSCLIKRYCEGKFVPKYIATIGVDYGVKPTKLADKEVRINFFDLSGLDAYSEIRNEFYKDASAVFLVFAVDDRESFGHIDQWLKEAKGCGLPAVPIFLVGNKCDARRVVSVEEAKRTAESKGMIYYDVSANTGHDVNPMFDAMFTKAIEQLNASTR